jgi:NADPH:quinone reductase-like Zn-dependent oxidoreductase
MPERMRAVVQQAFGGPEVLEVAEVDWPVPLATEVLVRVEAAGVNPVEPLIRSGQFPLIGQPPFILGWDISGVIAGAEGVTRFDVGDEVYGMPFFPRAYVVGTASAAKHEFVRSLGADELIDHQTRDFAAVLGDLDVVLDSLGGEIARRSISVLRPGGMLVTIVGRRDADLAARTRAAGRRFAGLSVEPDYPGLEALTGLVDSGQLRVHLQTTLPLAEAARAHQLLESGRTTGKIVLTT